MSGHTPGPWIVDRTVALGAYGVWKDVRSSDEPMCQICSVFPRNESDVSREERDANAALIAAAPDLLAACESAYHELDPELQKQTRLYLGCVIEKARGRRGE